MNPPVFLALALLMTPQSASDVRRLYDEGRYEEVVRAADQARDAADNASRLQYLAAQSYEKLNDPGAARRAYQRVVASGAGGPWASIGRSAAHVMDKQLDLALASVNEALEIDGSVPEAHYQRGMVLMLRREYGDASTAFKRATELEATFAGAHYYAGLANYRAKRLDLMTAHFEAFIKLAPNAPERPEVESILRTVRR